MEMLVLDLSESTFLTPQVIAESKSRHK